MHARTEAPSVLEWTKTQCIPAASLHEHLDDATTRAGVVMLCAPFASHVDHSPAISFGTYSNNVAANQNVVGFVTI